MKIQWLKQVNHFFYRHYGAMYQFFAVFFLHVPSGYD
jgi:hypothetical protein